MNPVSSFILPRSLRSKLLIWLLGPLLIIGLIAIYDSYRQARRTADIVSDRVLSGSALAIAERVFVNEDNALEVDIPYVALQMLTSSEDDRVFYRIETAEGDFVTGYRGLELPPSVNGNSNITFQNGVFRGESIRLAVYSGAASSNASSFGFRVGIAETTNARSAIAQSILVRSTFRQALLLLSAAILVWWVVTSTLRPLQRVEQAIARRNLDDVRPIRHAVPSEVNGLVLMINELLERFAASISALQNFTSNASHQFRTPLALIKTHLEVATREDDPAKQREAMGLAKTAVGDAERLMSQMLLLAKLDSSTTNELRTRTCDLSQIAREVCEEFVLQLSHQGRSDVDLGFEASGAITIYADKTLAQEVIRNLVDNSIKHSGDNPKIDVSVYQDSKSGIVCVRDTGVGFEYTQKVGQKRIGRFSVDDASKNNTGLGLSIIEEIVDLFEGDLILHKAETSVGMEVRVRFKLHQ